MNDNEKLIEEARQELEWMRNGVPLTASLVIRLADALGAVEKAHTPTDDGRAICSTCGVPFRLIQHNEGCDVREEGEPPAAQVHRVAEAMQEAYYAVGDGWSWTDISRAALRAAGDVR